jgi:hypothetical protein
MPGIGKVITVSYSIMRLMQNVEFSLILMSLGKISGKFATRPGEVIGNGLPGR